MKRLLTQLTGLALVSALASCSLEHGELGGDSSTTTAMRVTPSLGIVKNADVRVLDADGVAIAGASGELTDTGSVSLDIPDSVSGPIIVEVLGDADATYFNEATGQDEPFEDGRRMRVVLPAPQATVGVTPLTEIAAARFVAANGSTAADANQANEAVRSQLLPGVASITAEPTLVADTSAEMGANTDADVYALFLASMAQLTTNSSVSLLDFMEQIAEDMSDSELDGAVFGDTLTNPVIDTQSNAFDTLFDNAVSGAVSSYGASGVTADSLQSAFDSDDGGSDGGSQTRVCVVGSAADVDQLPAAISSQVIDFDVDFIASGASFPLGAVGDTVEYTFSGSGQLFFNNTSFSSDPYTCGGNLNEINWYNATSQELYAVSLVNDEINELNYSVGDPLVFSAQLVVSDSGAGETGNTISGVISNAQGLSGQWELFLGGSLSADGGLTAGAVTYGSDIASGTTYEVRASNAGCSVSNATGTVSGSDIGDVNISCSATAATYSLSGNIDNADTVSGQWELFVNDSLLADGGLNTGAVTYGAALADGSRYEVRVSSAECDVVNPTGTLNGADVGNIDISCVAASNTYSVSGTIVNGDGVSGQWEAFEGGAFAADGGLGAGAVTFLSGLSDGASFVVSASNADCNVANGTGSIASADVSNVTITCVEGSSSGGGSGALSDAVADIFGEEGFKPVLPTDVPSINPQIGEDIRHRIPTLYANAVDNAKAGLFGDQGATQAEISFNAYGAAGVHYTLNEYAWNEGDVEPLLVRSIEYSNGADGASQTADDMPLQYQLFDNTFAEDGLVSTYTATGPGDDDIWFTDDDYFVGSSVAYNVFYLESDVIDNAALVAGSIAGGSTIGLDPGEDGILFTEDDDIGRNTFVVPYTIISYGVNESVGQSVTFTGPGADGVWFTTDDDIGLVIVANSDDQGTEVGAITYNAAGDDGVWFTADDQVLNYSVSVLDDNHRIEYTVVYMSPGVDDIWFNADDPEFSYTFYGFDQDGEPSFVATHAGIGADGVWFTADDQASAVASKITRNGQEFSATISHFGADLTWLTGDDQLTYYSYTEFDDDGRLLAQGGVFIAGADGLWFTDDDEVSGYRTRYEYDDQGRTVFQETLGSHPSYSVYVYQADGNYLSVYVDDPGSDAVFGTSDDVAYSSSGSEQVVSGTTIYSYVTSPGADNQWFTADDVLGRFRLTEDRGSGVSAVMNYSAGADGTPLTADDVLESLELIETQGDETRYVGYTAGVDGVLDTEDDVVASLRVEIRSADGLRHTSRYYAAGPDGVLDTDDDTQSFAAETHYDADGLALRSIYYDALDAVTSYSENQYTSSGEYAGALYYSQGLSEGPDGLLYTSDDVPSSGSLPVSLDYAAATANNTGYVAASCDVSTGATGSISVSVNDRFGLPVADATVMLGSNASSVVTDTNGTAIFDALIGPQDVHVLKEGSEWESFLCVEPSASTHLSAVIHPMNENDYSRVQMTPNTQSDLILMLNDQGEVIAKNINFAGDFPTDLRLLNTGRNLYFPGVPVGQTVTGALWAIDIARGSNSSYDILADAVLIDAEASFTTISDDFTSDETSVTYDFPGAGTHDRVECTSSYCQSGALRWNVGLASNGFYSTDLRTNIYEFTTNLPSDFAFADVLINVDNGAVVTALPDAATIADVQIQIPNASQVALDGRFPTQNAMGLTVATVQWKSLRQFDSNTWFVGQSLALEGYDSSLGATRVWTLHMPAGTEMIELPVLPSSVTDISIGMGFNVEQTYRTHGGAGYQDWIQSADFRELPVGEDAEQRVYMEAGAVFTR